ncbi:hypothetical protein CLV28_2028 [Sediminihabitans luteus]|uniref:Uncharacterized protein n=1 Tax=Sediminihabitans luteus TaxID=1138585 RepID=A0A2M9CE94_9CELL|nr:hypothetical protein [Sediminihabitans luteus]PJJ70198.1 hypothetical protein CLV28_2028 [Sediminihabitans luteus]GII97669.1 hypothetical protein Slu03_00470 [Sediminihabitans luteus]
MHGTRGATPRRAVAFLRAFAQAAVVLCALVTTLLVTAGSSGYALVHQCVPLTGGAAWAGSQLAVVRATPDCPEGVALGGTTAAAVHVVIVLALPALVAHLVALLLVWGGADRLARGLDRLRVIVGARLHDVLALLAPRAVDAPAPRDVPVGVVRSRPLARLAGVVVRRGPPALAA